MTKRLASILQDGYFDLHTHTQASDGVYTPHDLVVKAKKAGLKAVAITDHDTLAGVAEAVQTGQSHGIEVIPGVELSTKYKGISVDVLGYDIEHFEQLDDQLREMRTHREDRARRIVEKFCEMNMPLTMDDVLHFSKGGVIARPHIAKALVKKRYVPDVQAAFDLYLADGKPCCLDKQVLSPQEAIEMIHKHGGLAVLAHPVYIGEVSIIRELLDLGFDGIEVWHRSHFTEHIQTFHELAREYNILATGGSDFHHDEHVLGQFGRFW